MNAMNTDSCQIRFCNSSILWIVCTKATQKNAEGMSGKRVSRRDSGW